MKTLASIYRKKFKFGGNDWTGISVPNSIDEPQFQSDPSTGGLPQGEGFQTGTGEQGSYTNGTLGGGSKAGNAAAGSMFGMVGEAIDANPRYKQGITKTYASGQGAIVGASKGAQMGSAIGPYGTIIGAAAGGIYGYIKGKSNEKKEKKAIASLDVERNKTYDEWSQARLANNPNFAVGDRNSEMYKNGGELKKRYQAKFTDYSGTQIYEKGGNVPTSDNLTYQKPIVDSFVRDASGNIISNPVVAQSIANPQKPGTFSTTKDRSKLKNAYDIVTNPFTAAQQLITKQPVTGRGEQNIYDKSLDFIPAMLAARELPKIPENLKKGNYVSAGLNALSAAPILGEIPFSKTYKLNPWAKKLNNPNNSYRAAGKDAYEDFKATGVVRSKRTFSDNPTLEEKVIKRTTGFPSFQKGKVDPRYTTPDGVIFETELPTYKRGDVNPVTNKVIKSGHYAHRVIDATGKTATEIPASMVKTYKAKPNWLTGYVQMKAFGGSLSSSMLTNQKTIGGSMIPMSKDTTLASGPSHEQGGIGLPNQGAEIEGGETTSGDYVFSKALGFAQLHKPIARAEGKIQNKPATAERMKSLALLQGRTEKLKATQELVKQHLNLQ